MTTFSIPSLNLMRSARVAAAQRRRRIRYWGLAIAAYAVVLAGTWGYHAYRGGQAGNVAADLAVVADKIDRLKGELKAAQASLLAAQREQEAAREVRNHPDMSALLTRITNAAGPLITLDRLEVRPVVKSEEKGKKSDLATPHGYTLKLTGLSSEQVDVPRFAQALQALGIFEKVAVVSIKAKETPIKLNRKGEPIKSTPLFAFDLEGVFSDKGAGQSLGGQK